MDTGRATGAASRVLSYGSQTMTTGFVLKATLAWHVLGQAGNAPATGQLEQIEQTALRPS
jgi:hypothetical protein